MAYVTINSNTIEVGDALKSDLFTTIKNDLDDHEARLIALGSGAGKVSLINTDINVGSTGAGFLTGALYVEVIQDCLVTEGAIQLFVKSPATTGSLTVDVKKNTSTNPSGFNSLFTSAPTLSMSTATDYQRTTGAINPATQSLVVGDILKVDITSLPAGLQKFRIVLVGEF